MKNEIKIPPFKSFYCQEIKVRFSRYRKKFTQKRKICSITRWNYIPTNNWAKEI